MKKRLLAAAGCLILLAILLEGFFIVDFFNERKGQRVYQVVDPIEIGQTVRASQIKTIELKGDTLPDALYMSEAAIGKVASRPLRRGDLLLNSDFQNAKEQGATISMALTLTSEDAHWFDLVPNESVSALIIRNGAVEQLDHLIIQQVVQRQATEDQHQAASCQVTVMAELEVLKKLYEASITGNIRLLKKIIP